MSKRNDRNNTTDTIMARSSVKFPISLIAGGMVSFSLFLYAQLELHKRDDDRRFEATYETIDRKTAARYTSLEARQHTESIKQRLLDIEKSNDATHKSFQRQLNRHTKEIAALEEK